MFASQVFIGLKTIFDQDITRIHCHFLLIYDGIGAAFLQSLGSKLVTIERATFQCEKDTALRTVAAIGRDAGMLLIELIELFNVHNDEL